jgi:hypothetical protein
VLTTRDLNRAVLARQSLLERRQAPLPRVVESMGGVQAQYAPSTYVGLWSRVEAIDREAVTRALERRSLVQATLMRSTIHIVSRPASGRSRSPFGASAWPGRDARRARTLGR